MKATIAAGAYGIVLAAAVYGCTGSREESMTTTRDVHDQAAVLARELLIVDTHMDVPYQLMARSADIAEYTTTTNFDYPRAVEGGLDCAFFAVFVSHAFEGNGGKDQADKIMTSIEQLVARRPDRFAIVRTPDAIGPVRQRGQIAIGLGMENGTPLEGDLKNIQHFYDRGIRYITLTHVHPNHIGDASWDDQRPWNGLSPFGEQVVAEMNRLGMIVDISHLSDSAAFDVLRVSRAPVLATHSSCRFFTPGFERNISDDLIRAVAARGGSVNINFGSMFLVDSIRKASDNASAEIKKYLAEHNLKSTDEQAIRFTQEYRKAHSIHYADVKDVAAHIDHVVRLAGIDHVGLGSDFDGLGDDLPNGLKDVSGYPNLIAELLKLGYTRDQIEKVCSGNVLRVWRAVEQVAREIREAEK